MKHVGAPKSRSVWASIIMGLLHLIMIGAKKHGAGFKNSLGPFALHDASRSNLVVSIEVGHFHFLILLAGD
jgi:hypothetical protein